jgi:hypothetical protein
MTNEKRPDPNATIQLDAMEALDQILVDDPRVSPSAAPTTSRHAPPPLPPSMPPLAETMRSAEKSRGGVKTIAYVAGFVALLVLAIAGGLAVGGVGRSPAPAASVTILPAAAPSAAAVAPAAPSSTDILVIPPTEIRSP